MRSNKLNPHGTESADFIEFLGTAAVGQAEAGNLRWQDVDFAKKRIQFRRQKTKRYFHVPLFKNSLLPLLERRKAQLGREPGDDEFVFSIKDGKKVWLQQPKPWSSLHILNGIFEQCGLPIGQLTFTPRSSQVGRAILMGESLS